MFAPFPAAARRESTLEREAALSVVAIGMSAGGLGALRTIVEMLPPSSCAAVVIAHHVGGVSVIPQLIRLWSGLDACFAADNDQLEAGRIYVCPPGHHVVVKPNGVLGVVRRERIAFVRPSINWLFESAAASFENRTIAILLSGANDDGTRGARCIRKAGGLVIAQAPATCSFPAMPLHAIAACAADLVLRPADVVPTVMELLRFVASNPERRIA